jgi:hypothetical protein
MRDGSAASMTGRVFRFTSTYPYAASARHEHAMRGPRARVARHFQTGELIAAAEMSGSSLLVMLNAVTPAVWLAGGGLMEVLVFLVPLGDRTWRARPGGLSLVVKERPV